MDVGRHYDWLRDDREYAAKFAAAEPEARRSAKAKQGMFLRAFARTALVTSAARAAKIDRRSHYYWLRNDPEYRAAFERQADEADGDIEEVMTRLALQGEFEPAIYKGKYCYENRKRVRCVLADGTEAFEDELLKPHAKILTRRVVLSPDGPQIGVTRIDTGSLFKLAAARMPYRFGNKVRVTGDITITDPEEAKRELLRLAAGFDEAGAAGLGDSGTE